MPNTNLTAVSAVIARMQSCLEGSNNEAQGICASMNDPATALFRNLAESWPYWSGDSFYPIPSINYNWSARQSFDRMGERGSLWDGPCKTLRRDLCAYVLTYLTDPEFIAAKTWKSEAVEYILNQVEIDYV